MRFQDRADAGQRLASSLKDYADRKDVLLMALPRGGVPVAAEVAQALNLPLDVMLVRKLGLPGHEELAMGAIALGDVRVLNRDVIASSGVSDAALEQVTDMQKKELNRRNTLYRGDRPAPDLKNKTVILIDDGVATGATMKAAVQAVQKAGARETVVALPVGAGDSCEDLRGMVDRLICLDTPFPFFGVGQWYRHFGQTSDEEVQALLEPFQDNRD